MNMPTEQRVRRPGLINRKYREYLLPNIVNMTSLSLSVMIDAVIVGNMAGPDALAAVTVTTPIVFLFSALSSLLCSGGEVLVSMKKGERLVAEAERIFTVSLAVAFAVGAALLLLIEIFLDPLTALLCPDTTILPLFRQYLAVSAWYLPAMMLALQTQTYMVIDGMPRAAAAMMLTAAAINLCLDVVFMGPLKMGVRGAGAATVSSYIASLLFAAWYMRSPRRTLKLRAEALLGGAGGGRILGELCQAGAPAALSFVTTSARTVALNLIIIASAGGAGLVALSVCTNISSGAFIFIIACGSSLVPIASTLYGERDAAGLRFALRHALTASIFLAAAAALFIELFPAGCARLFGLSSARELALSISALRISSLAYPLVALANVFLFYYIAIKRSALAAAITVLGDFAVVTPLAFVLEKSFGVDGVWAAIPLSALITAAAIYPLALLDGRRSGKGPLFMPNGGDGELVEFSITNDEAAAVSAAEEAQRALERAGVGETAQIAAIAVEEMCVNICRYGYRQGTKNFIDVRIRAAYDEVAVAIRDDGAFFNPCEYRDDEGEEFLISGIRLVKALASEVRYDRILGMNNTTVILKRNDGGCANN